MPRNPNWFSWSDLVLVSSKPTWETPPLSIILARAAWDVMFTGQEAILRNWMQKKWKVPRICVLPSAWRRFQHCVQFGSCLQRSWSWLDSTKTWHRTSLFWWRFFFYSSSPLRYKSLSQHINGRALERIYATTNLGGQVSVTSTPSTQDLFCQCPRLGSELFSWEIIMTKWQGTPKHQ